MNMNFQTPGSHVPYMSYPYGTFVAAESPSRPASLCSEPIYQNSWPDGCCASPGIQMNTQKLQLVNSTMVDARRSKNVKARLPSRGEPLMMNFFQGGMPFSEQVSDSGEGSIQGGTISPRYCFMPPYHYQQAATAPFQLAVHNNLAGQSQTLEPGQYQQRDMQRITQQTHEVQKHEQENSEFSSCTKGCSEITGSKAEPYLSEADENESVIQPTGVRPYPQRKKTKQDIEGVSRQGSSAVARKKELLSKPWDVVKDERQKRKLIRKKQRKKVQQKNKLLHKTELCSHWKDSSTCTYKGKCFFAHAVDELKGRTRFGNFKTQACVDCTVGEEPCFFGSRCNYCHPGEAARRVVGKKYLDKDYYEKLKIDFPNNNYPFGIYV